MDMTPQSFGGIHGRTVDIDLCYACRGIWFDPQENLQLSPASVVDLFRLLHEHRNDPNHPLAQRLFCPRCHQPLAQGYDIVRSGRYVTHRCNHRHGRFSTFAAFMIEKGFIRQMTQLEIDDMAQRVAIVHCTSCGAPIDIRKEHACPHCRSALSLLDPNAVERALQGYAQAARHQGLPPRPTEVADALVMIERDRQKALREERSPGSMGITIFSNDRGTHPLEVDLWSAGVTLVWNLLR
ncbi:hypothetical protein Cenrod_1868 [Candidatus Symbiobacter mobilis CR]|uniref:Uncharacterized protein n=2 Tax=Candidatus Symbiobacter TaxID=1436289 RepID=U5NCR1_9BURK|nr:hypothetical protein Cenrod_1868 [Candidatus Symbiobacter mobilis CR]